MENSQIIIPNMPNIFILNFPILKPQIHTPITDYIFSESRDNIQKLSRDKLKELRTEIFKEMSDFVKTTRIDLSTKPHNKFDEAIKYISEFLAPPFYNLPCQTTDTEIINGLKLMNFSNDDIDFVTFEILYNLIISKEPRWRYKTFMKKTPFCTDWYKMDENGQSYGGFYMSTNEEEKKNAWNLTFQHNTKMLYKLPFHTKFLCKTIYMGCDNRMECVRFSNAIGVWVERKAQQMQIAWENYFVTHLTFVPTHLLKIVAKYMYK